MIRNYRYYAQNEATEFEHNGSADVTCNERAEGLICSRLADHTGRHEAGISDTLITASWETDDSVVEISRESLQELVRVAKYYQPV